MSKIYYFYCVVCGKRFKVSKSHATTCSADCRAALSKVKNKMDEEILPEDESRINEKASIIKNEFHSRESDEGIIKKIISKRKSESPPSA